MGASPGRQESQHGPLCSWSSQDIFQAHRTVFRPLEHLRAFAQAVLSACGQEYPVLPPLLPLSSPSGLHSGITSSRKPP